MLGAHLKKLKRRIDISSEEERVICGLVSEMRTVSADDVVVRAGEPLGSSFALEDGWMARSKDLRSGERQVIELHVAGDFPDLHGFTLKHLDHDVVAMTDCSIAVVPHDRLRDMIERYPRLARAYWFLTNIDGAIRGELALSLGQRSAIARMAHLFCEMNVRLDMVDAVKDNGYDFPLTQRELSECLGLTVVHANRTIQELRRRGLIELENRRLTILDRKGLEGVAEFDPGYLYLDKHDF
ncbi:MAG TPA: Crp/Fnr family transcriptional regulator [Sphingomicrobium sp.]|jgi:CRP-like cAMP-binding protein